MKKVFLVFLVPFLFSCTTLQKDVNIEQISYSDEVVSFEQRLSVIDAQSMTPDVDLSDQLQKDQRIEDFLSDISIALDDPSIQKSSRSRLFALQGKAFLIAGRKTKARSAYESSISEYKGDTQSVILAYRLGFLDVKNIEDKIGEVSERSLLVLENAIKLYTDKSYADSVAKFDEAFLSLDEFYQDSYRKIRDLAWNMRSVDASSTVANLMPLSEITVAQMLFIAKEKSDFLSNLAGGKKTNDKNFYYKVSSAGLLNPVSKPIESKNVLGASDIVTRYYSARFLWNLYNMKRNPSDATKYSSRIKKSPVSDLSIDSPDFDAVLGCVEKEFMSLEDGRNFGGDKSVSAIEFDSFIERLKN